jgi:hypothetical protein
LEEKNMGAYLFVHFIGTESKETHEQLYFSVSKDGIEWKTLNKKAADTCQHDR